MTFFLEKLWYGRHPLRWILWPLSFVYRSIVFLRRTWLRLGAQKHTTPIIVVGNLTTGGVGKTPLVIALVQAFQKKGLRVGVVSRGYGASINRFPYLVSTMDKAEQVGDEPLLIARKTGSPVVIAPKRNDAVRYLLQKFQSDIVISDDGLQHYAMGRAVEIVVIDGVRGFGNNMCLPAGPLREPRSRLKKVDFVVVNGGIWPGAWQMTLEPGSLTHIQSGEPISLQTLLQPIAAVAGIGHPQRFFNSLLAMGLTCKPYIFPDHHPFVHQDLVFSEKSLVMTEKDAVKCQSFSEKHWYFLPVEACLDEGFWQALWSHEQLKGYV